MHQLSTKLKLISEHLHSSNSGTIVKLSNKFMYFIAAIIILYKIWYKS
jgi:hypothetical protein